MHNLLMGHSRDMFAFATVETLREGLLGAGEPNWVLNQFWVECGDWCKANGLKKPSGTTLSLRTLGLDRLNEKKYPELSSAFKASSTLTMLIFLAWKMKEVCTGTPKSKLRTWACWSLAQYFNVLASSKLVMTKKQCQRAYAAGHLNLLCCQELCRKAHEVHEYLWRLRQKSHYFDHNHITSTTPYARFWCSG